MAPVSSNAATFEAQALTILSKKASESSWRRSNCGDCRIDQPCCGSKSEDALIICLCSLSDSRNIYSFRRQNRRQELEVDARRAAQDCDRSEQNSKVARS